MNFTTFLKALQDLETGISITTPVTMKVKSALWGAPGKALVNLPAVINTLAEPERTLGFGSREERYRVQVQLAVAEATVDDPRNSLIATSFWFAFKDAFDKDPTLTLANVLTTLRGSEPTVPVRLEHAGQSYIGFSGVLDMQIIEGFTYG